MTQRLGRTVLPTNRMDWTAEQVALGYSAQQDIERVFRGLKDGDWLGWGPIITGRIARSASMRSTACWASPCCSTCINRRRPPGTESPWNNSWKNCGQIQQFVLLYPPQGQKGPNRVTTLLSKQTLPQQALAKTLGLDQLHITLRG